MYSFDSVADRDAVVNEMPWEQRDRPVTLYGRLSQTARDHGKRPAVSYQITSGPTDPVETVTWQEVHDKSVQAANLFRKLGVGENDVVAYLLPNANETLYALMGGARMPRCWSRSGASPRPTWRSWPRRR